jgi:ABC-2 type transport system ATP-binding protein
MNKLAIRNFSKYYSATLAVSVSNLEFSAGAYWIKGENGSGKTTFFKCLTGLFPCQGTIEFEDGVNLHKHPVEYRKRVNYSEAEPLYPGFLTPKDLVRFIGKTKGSPIDQQRYYFENFGIDQYQNKPCNTCSSGMLKKLCLALAFLGSPKVIILDEPLITLDLSSRSTLISFINDYVKLYQTVFLISSHQILENSVPLKETFTIENKVIHRG